MSFWDKSGPQAPPQQQPEQQRSPWWQADTPAQQPPPQHQQPQHPLMQQEPQQEYRPKGITSSSGGCPECGSPNYMVFENKGRVLNTQTQSLVATSRCFDCGWPAENSERGTGKLVGDVTGHAKQVAGAGGVVKNWHPEIIVARAAGPRGPRTQS